MQIVGQRDDHAVYRAGVEQRAMLTEHGDPAFGERPQFRLVQVADGGQLKLRIRFDGIEEEGSDRPETDDAEPHRARTSAGGPAGTRSPNSSPSSRSRATTASGSSTPSTAE